MFYKIVAIQPPFNGILLGKEKQIKLALVYLLTSELQFTSDMLPSDILGVSIFESKAQQFSFHKGPVFCQLLLADEIIPILENIE